MILAVHSVHNWDVEQFNEFQRHSVTDLNSIYNEKIMKMKTWGFFSIMHKHWQACVIGAWEFNF